MPDTRIFRITREWPDSPRGLVPRAPRFRNPRLTPKIEYGNRAVASAKCGAGGFSHHHGPVVKVEATNEAATEGWTDVSEEFGIFHD